jgi:hypothetical protein
MRGVIPAAAHGGSVVVAVALVGFIVEDWALDQVFRCTDVCVRALEVVAEHVQRAVNVEARLCRAEASASHWAAPGPSASIGASTEELAEAIAAAIVLA